VRNAFIPEVLSTTFELMRGKSASRPPCPFVPGVAFLLVAMLWPGFAWSQSAATATPTFRPGTAGSPFAWTSVVADFNADGRPDIAVADRVGGRGSSTYRIEFELSSGHHQLVSFASTYGALSITAVDVDNDHDVDLVITPVLSRHVVGVWLNDGTGHFRDDGSRNVAASYAQLSPASIGSRASFGLPATTTERRMAVAVPLSRVPTPISSVTTRYVTSIVPPQPPTTYAVSLRAPPARV